MIRALLWSALAFMAFGALAFLGFVAHLIVSWRKDRQDAKRFAMDPVRPPPHR